MWRPLRILCTDTLGGLHKMGSEFLIGTLAEHGPSPEPGGELTVGFRGGLGEVHPPAAASWAQGSEQASAQEAR